MYIILAMRGLHMSDYYAGERKFQVFDIMDGGVCAVMPQAL